MSAFCHQNRLRRRVRAPETFSINTILCSALLLWVCMAFAAPALALERMAPDDPSAVVSTDGKMGSSPAKARAAEDSCFALLKTGSDGGGFATPATVNAPAASQTAVLGFVFGLRFALGPKPAAGSSRASLAFWQPGVDGDQALAIADYRHCRNEAALRDANR